MKKITKEVKIKKILDKRGYYNLDLVREIEEVYKEAQAEQLILSGLVVQIEQLRFLIDKFQTPKGNYLIDLLMEHKESKEKP